MPIVQAVVDDWATYVKRPHLSRAGTVSEVKFAVLYGLTSHTHELAKAYLRLADTHPEAAIPLVRAMFECAVDAQWVYHQSQGAEAMAEEHGRQQGALAKQMLKIGGDWSGRGATLQALNEALPRFTPAASARSFESICNFFDCGPELYLIYRLLCGHTHAGVRVADPYLHLDPDGTLSLLRFAQRDGSDSTWSWVAGKSLIWAGAALNDAVARPTRGNLLNRQNNDLGGGLRRLRPRAAST